MPLLCWHCRAMQTARCEGSCSTQVPLWHLPGVPSQGDWSALCHPCPDLLPSLISVAWSPCSSCHTMHLPLPKTGNTASLPGTTALLCFPCLLRASSLKGSISKWLLRNWGPCSPVLRWIFKENHAKNDQLLRNTIVSMGCS